MAKNNIPIYRAKKVDGDGMVEGYHIKRYGRHGIGTIDDDGNSHYTANDIDPNTLAIHFPNMIDKNGKKIFASLSEDGVGGDIFQEQDTRWVWKHDAIHGLKYLDIDNSLGTCFDDYLSLDDGEVIGIYKGE